MWDLDPYPGTTSSEVTHRTTVVVHRALGVHAPQ